MTAATRSQRSVPAQQNSSCDIRLLVTGLMPEVFVTQMMLFSGKSAQSTCKQCATLKRHAMTYGIGHGICSHKNSSNSPLAMYRQGADLGTGVKDKLLHDFLDDLILRCLLITAASLSVPFDVLCRCSRVCVHVLRSLKNF